MSVTFKVNQFKEDLISWNEIREIMGNIAYLISTSFHEEGRVFTMHSNDLERLNGFARSMIALYDVFYEITHEQDKYSTIPLIEIPRIQPLLIVQMQSNALQPRNIFINFLNQVIDTLRFQIYFEIIDKGIITFVQDRASYLFIARALNRSFIEVILKSEQSLNGSNRHNTCIELLKQLGISLLVNSKSS